MALTSPSDPAASFLLLLLLLLIFCRCFSIKQLTPARPAAHPGPAAPGETPPPARRAGQGGGSGLHLLHSAGAGFQSPPDPGGKRESAAGRPQCLRERRREPRPPPVLRRARAWQRRPRGALTPPLPSERHSQRPDPRL